MIKLMILACAAFYCAGLYVGRHWDRFTREE